MYLVPIGHGSTSDEYAAWPCDERDPLEPCLKMPRLIYDLSLQAEGESPFNVFDLYPYGGLRMEPDDFLVMEVHFKSEEEAKRAIDLELRVAEDVEFAMGIALILKSLGRLAY